MKLRRTQRNNISGDGKEETNPGMITKKKKDEAAKTTPPWQRFEKDQKKSTLKRRL